MDVRDFIKMNGAGNDFVVLDLRPAEIAGTNPRRAARPTAAQAAAIADRQRGVGCDQVILIEPPETDLADAQLVFLNADGSESGACGNGTRCVADLLMTQLGTDAISLETEHGVLDCDRDASGLVTVDMGRAKTDWRDIPLAEPRDTLHLAIGEGPLSDPAGTSMGNPHATFFVDDVAEIPLAALGPKLEHHKLFPERANIGVAEMRGRDTMRLRVWERGSGLTLACGSGACAAVVAAVRRGVAERRVTVEVDGGSLVIEWLESGHVLMSGPTAVAFRGTLDPDLLKV